MPQNRRIAVYGASGLTGGFVVSDLLARGWEPVLSGRDGVRLRGVAAAHGEGLDVRVAPVGDPAALDRALTGVAAVVNCAGPFALTAGPVIEAALRAGVSYLDVAAEVEAVADVFAGYDEAAKGAGVAIVPAMAFYGGLGDLLTTAAVGDWPGADEICLAYALDGWRPTAGTRATGQVSAERRGGRRVVYSRGRLEHRTGEPPVVDWDFPDPVGRLRVSSEFTTADSVTIPRHIATPEVRTFMSSAAARAVSDPDAELRPSDDHDGRAAQRFLVEVVARRGAQERRAVARGRDIYGISGPLAVEAATRVVRGEVTRAGVVSPGQAFDAAGFLGALPLEELSVG
ncbi:MAG TPA: saccharopine dehydrogenase NADP-binding domain-containing protein [Acidimicrobiales bacterium]